MKLAFRKWAGAGSPVLILHGLLGASDNWVGIAKQLVNTHSVYLLDLRNHGRSPHTPEVTVAAMARDVHEFILDHNLQQTSILGHSLGGKVAMMLAFNYPLKVKQLIVVDVAPKLYSSGFFKNIFELLLGIETEKISSREAADAFLAPYIPERHIRSFLLKNLARGENHGFYWKPDLRALYQNLENIFADIPKEQHFNGPALFIGGEKADYILPEDHLLIKKSFPEAQIVMLPDAGHWIHIDAPQAFLKHVRTFLEAPDSDLRVR